MRPIMLGAAVAAVLAAGPAWGQPEPQPPQPPAHQGQARETDPAAFRARLERMLEDLKTRQEQIQAALKRLDGGASPDEVRRGLDEGPRPPRMGPDRPMREGMHNRMREGPGGRGSPMGGPGAEMRPRPEIDQEAVLAFLDEHNPDLAKRVRDAMKESPEAGARILGRLGPHIREVIAERDPETKDLRIAELKNGWQVIGEFRKLREAAKTNDAAAREQSLAHLRELFGQHFDVQIKLHEREIVTLEQRLTKLRQDLADQRGGREEFIAKRIEQITREGEGPKGPEAKPPEKK